MKILLVNPPVSMEKIYGRFKRARGMMPPLGLAYIACVLEKDNHELRILDCNMLSSSQSVVHADNTVRLQTVSYECNPRYYRIIEKIGDIAGTYAVLTTSYNMYGELIVCSPRDALDTFK